MDTNGTSSIAQILVVRPSVFSFRFVAQWMLGFPTGDPLEKIKKHKIFHCIHLIGVTVYGMTT